MKKLKGIEIIISSIAFVLIVALAGVFGVLKTLSLIDCEASSFQLIMTVLTFGLGLYLTIFAIVRKGEYEYMIGGVLLVIGLALLLSTLQVKTAVIIIVSVCAFLILFALLFLLKAKDVSFETTDKKEGYVPYMENLKNEKELEKENKEEIPEIKSFKD